MDFDLSALQGSIRALNAELAQYSQTFGNESRVVQDLMTNLEEVVGSKNVYYSARAGAWQFRNTTAVRNKLRRAEDKEAVADWYNDAADFEDYANRLADKFEQQYGDDPTEEDLRDFQRDIDTVRDAADDGTLAKIVSEQARQGVNIKDLTYSEVAELVRRYADDNEKEARSERARVHVVNGRVDKPKIHSAKVGGFKNAGGHVEKI